MVCFRKMAGKRLNDAFDSSGDEGEEERTAKVSVVEPNGDVGCDRGTGAIYLPVFKT